MGRMDKVSLTSCRVCISSHEGRAILKYIQSSHFPASTDCSTHCTSTSWQTVLSTDSTRCRTSSVWTVFSRGTTRCVVSPEDEVLVLQSFSESCTTHANCFSRSSSSSCAFFSDVMEANRMAGQNFTVARNGTHDMRRHSRTHFSIHRTEINSNPGRGKMISSHSSPSTITCVVPSVSSAEKFIPDSFKSCGKPGRACTFHGGLKYATTSSIHARSSEKFCDGSALALAVHSPERSTSVARWVIWETLG
ncbi:hypothetical protein, conserved [Angomonas deanei]|uniref:Uncharacterized protein n=1 Tax=Angomonas deanei TaxID=59799 RepID=A0A7G2CIW0_9TRYP|nr:hypothetical protein, conserved [Angomonas deanei]